MTKPDDLIKYPGVIAAGVMTGELITIEHKPAVAPSGRDVVQELTDAGARLLIRREGLTSGGYWTAVLFRELPLVEVGSSTSQPANRPEPDPQPDDLCVWLDGHHCFYAHLDAHKHRLGSYEIIRSDSEVYSRYVTTHGGPTKRTALAREQLISEMVNRFLSWTVPSTLVSDPCMTDPNYLYRHGTNIMNAEQAREMLLYVAADLLK